MATRTACNNNLQPMRVGLTWLLLLLVVVGVVVVEAQTKVPDDCAHVVGVTVTESTNATATAGVYYFATSVASSETGDGWDKFADEWRIVMIYDATTSTIAAGTILGTRPLGHPHVNEQPFTRDLDGVVIPSSVDAILVEARDSVLGYCGDVMVLTRNGRTNTWTAGPRTSRPTDPTTPVIAPAVTTTTAATFTPTRAPTTQAVTEAPITVTTAASTAAATGNITVTSTAAPSGTLTATPTLTPATEAPTGAGNNITTVTTTAAPTPSPTAVTTTTATSPAPTAGNVTMTTAVPTPFPFPNITATTAPTGTPTNAPIAIKPIPANCASLDTCFLENIKTGELTALLVNEPTAYVANANDRYTIVCETSLEGTTNAIDFTFDGRTRTEWKKPWYMNGNTANRVNKAEYLTTDCGSKTIMVVGRVWKGECFRVTYVLESACAW